MDYLYTEYTPDYFWDLMRMVITQPHIGHLSVNKKRAIFNNGSFFYVSLKERINLRLLFFYLPCKQPLKPQLYE
jgi:hypothetical protein